MLFKFGPFSKVLILICTLNVACLNAKAYSILAHQAIIDAAFKPAILPLLKQKYPVATHKELLKAHSYCYGGAMVADMGYMPFGNAFFTDLLHYSRSGDFVAALLRDAQNLNEYAFALGALSHYMADKYGHSMATNLNVPLIYPRLQKKFGNVVTYADDNTSHSRMEFSYDVLEIGLNNYTSQGYHDFIGFNISVPVLQKAFYETYGINLNTIFSNIDNSINMFRWGVRNLFPVLTKTAFKLNKAEIKKINPGMTAKEFRYKMSRRSFNLEYGKEREQPKFFARVTVFLISILPKIGPLKTLKFQSPGHEGEILFIKSFEAIVQNYSGALKTEETGSVTIPDIDFDTGNPSHVNEYTLADITYNKLLLRLQDQSFKNVTPQLRQNIIDFYANADTSKIADTDKKNWKNARIALGMIKTLQPVPQDSLKTIN